MDQANQTNTQDGTNCKAFPQSQPKQLNGPTGPTSPTKPRQEQRIRIIGVVRLGKVAGASEMGGEWVYL
jgi:hypothetical protein